MNKEQQDLAWASLPKEARERIKSSYEYQCLNSEYDRGFNEALEAIFDVHNLTSDTEPSELLHVERKKVMSRYKYISLSIAWNDGDVRAFKAELSLLKELFGDKCLPDKEPMKIDAADSLIAMAKDEMGIDEQPKPKFEIGQKVRSKRSGAVYTVKDNVNKDGYGYRFVESPCPLDECDLEPYVEPKFKVGDKVYQTSGTNRLEEYTIKKVYKDKSRGFVYDIQGLIGIMGIEENNLCSSCQNPYTKPKTKNNMEKKKQFDLYVKGNIISNGKLSLDGESGYGGLMRKRNERNNHK